MWLSLVGTVVVLIDQATKWWVSQSLPVGQSHMVLPGMLYVTHVYNPGAAFGLFPYQQTLLIGAAFAVLAFVWLRRREIGKQSFGMRLGVTLGIAGAVGNLIDRVVRGAVLDFIEVPVLPVFNIADMSIVVGVAVLFWVILTERDAVQQKGG